MKAIVQDRFGPPGTLRLADIGLPEIGPGDVLVRVHAAALNPYDWHMLRGDPPIARLIPGGVGLTRPKYHVAGLDAAGRVEAAGPNVRELRPGDEVLGLCPGAFAEYARAEAGKLVPKPASLTFEQAAAIPIAATTALRGSGRSARCGPGTGCWSTGRPFCTFARMCANRRTGARVCRAWASGRYVMNIRSLSTGY
jgi:NADPH:quinone reductase-like Zn-dependent oxidoreductase